MGPSVERHDRAGALVVLPRPSVEWCSNGDGPHWRLTGAWQPAFPLTWPVPLRKLKVPSGFRTDLASVPRPLRWAIQCEELSPAAAVAHDWLYQHEGRVPSDWLKQSIPIRSVTRTEADRLLRLVAREQGVSAWRAWTGWAAVRLFGWFAWRIPGRSYGHVV